MGCGGNCSCCRDSRRNGWRKKRLGEIGHVFSVTFLLITDSWGLKGGGETEVVRETLDVEETLAQVTGLFVFGATI